MTLEENVNKLVNEIKGAKSDLMVVFACAVFATIASCNSCIKMNDVLSYVKPELKVENVIGKEAPEKFYEINRQKVYLEIDGKPVDQYVKEKQ
ncbi:MAG TPA: hypothetical protein VJI68_01980 [Candidatus Nanoarchaeia archaeon]|nr:hypothetical protein [Candidatus Nanoarchaeia archaeon]